MTTEATTLILAQQERVRWIEQRQEMAPEPPPIIYDADAVLRQHRRDGHFECEPCDPKLPWAGPNVESHALHQARALYTAGLLDYRPTGWNG